MDGGTTTACISFWLLTCSCIRPHRLGIGARGVVRLQIYSFRQDWTKNVQARKRRPQKTHGASFPTQPLISPRRFEMQQRMQKNRVQKSQA